MSVRSLVNGKRAAGSGLDLLYHPRSLAAHAPADFSPVAFAIAKQIHRIVRDKARVQGPWAPSSNGNRYRCRNTAFVRNRSCLAISSFFGLLWSPIRPMRYEPAPAVAGITTMPCMWTIRKRRLFLDQYMRKAAAKTWRQCQSRQNLLTHDWNKSKRLCEGISHSLSIFMWLQIIYLLNWNTMEKNNNMENRPDPDELLKHVQAEEQAPARKTENLPGLCRGCGQDLCHARSRPSTAGSRAWMWLLAIVETHKRAETEELCDGAGGAAAQDDRISQRDS